MPQIRQFQAPNLGLNPTETGVEADASAGRLAGRFFDRAAGSTEELAGQTSRFGAETAAVGEGVARDTATTIRDAGQTATQYVEHQEISHGAVAWANLNDQLTQQWNDVAKNADPNDPTVAQKFREQVLEPELQNFGQGFLTERGQRWAEAHVDALRNHMFDKTTADMSTLAGTAAALNIHNTETSMSNTAVKDPSSVPHLLSSVDSVVGGVVDSSPNIRGADAQKAKMDLSQKMRENIVKSGAFGAIQTAADPEAEAAKWAKAYPDLINGPEELQLARAAKVQSRTNLLIEKQTQAYNDHLADQQVKKGVNDAFNKNVSIDPTTNKVVLSPNYFKDVLNVGKNSNGAPNAAATVKTYLDWGESQQRPGPVQSDPQTVTGLDGRMFADNNPTNELDILRAEADHKLSRSDAQTRLAIVKQREALPDDPPLKADRKEFFTRYAGTIDSRLANEGLHSALGQQRMFQAERDAINQEVALRAKGQDPRSLYDPSSPNFFGRPENIARYHVSMQQANDYTDKITKAGPGDTAAVTPIPVASEFKNFFSSGRAAREGVQFNPSTDLTTIKTTGGQPVTVNKMAAPHFEGFLKALEAEGYKINSVGGYNDRNKVGAPGTSEHAYGNAIDINPGTNAQHSGKSDLPANVAELASKYGLIWGGNWQGASNDPMHFEWSGVGARRAQAKAPAVGAVMQGFRFLGGDPSKQASWAKVQ